jgi:molybdenum cofactor biosynthesis protein B
MSTTVHIKQQTEHEQDAVQIWIVTVSDTRDPELDTTGQYLNKTLTEAGHAITNYVIVHDDETEISEQLDAAKADDDVQAIILHGGTGISPRDVTVPTVLKHLDEKIDGFGELFRMISYEEIGAFALMSRALAGIMNRKLVYALPGSENAVKTATEKLLLPTLKHAAFELQK